MIQTPRCVPRKRGNNCSFTGLFSCVRRSFFGLFGDDFADAHVGTVGRGECER